MIFTISFRYLFIFLVRSLSFDVFFNDFKVDFFRRCLVSFYFGFIESYHRSKCIHRMRKLQKKRKKKFYVSIYMYFFLHAEKSVNLRNIRTLWLFIRFASCWTCFVLWTLFSFAFVRRLFHFALDHFGRCHHHRCLNGIWPFIKISIR